MNYYNVQVKQIEIQRDRFSLFNARVREGGKDLKRGWERERYKLGLWRKGKYFGLHSDGQIVEYVFLQFVYQFAYKFRITCISI